MDGMGIYIYIYWDSISSNTRSFNYVTMLHGIDAEMPRWHPDVPQLRTGSMMRTASNCLRRAYAICTKQVEAGSVAGAVEN